MKYPHPLYPLYPYTPIPQKISARYHTLYCKFIFTFRTHFYFLKKNLPYPAGHTREHPGVYGRGAIARREEPEEALEEPAVSRKIPGRYPEEPADSGEDVKAYQNIRPILP